VLSYGHYNHPAAGQAPPILLYTCPRKLSNTLPQLVSITTYLRFPLKSKLSPRYKTHSTHILPAV
jgi:hypothetical protein